MTSVSLIYFIMIFNYIFGLIQALNYNFSGSYKQAKLFISYANKNNLTTNSINNATIIYIYCSQIHSLITCKLTNNLLTHYNTALFITIIFIQLVCILLYFLDNVYNDNNILFSFIGVFFAICLLLLCNNLIIFLFLVEIITTLYYFFFLHSNKLNYITLNKYKNLISFYL